MTEPLSPTPLSRTPLRVRYHECDPQGVVFNAHYLTYADMASFDAIKALFGSYTELTGRGMDMVVAESTLRYHAACRFDDAVEIATFAERVGNTSLVLRFEMRRGDDLVTEVTNRYVWVSTETLRPVPPPDDVREAFTQFAG